MVRHDHPGDEAILLTVQMKDRVLYEFGDTLVGEQPFAVVLVQVCLDTLSQSGIGDLSVFEVFFPPVQYGLRHGVGKAEGDELRHLAGIDMWDVASAVRDSRVVHRGSRLRSIERLHSGRVRSSRYRVFSLEQLKQLCQFCGKFGSEG